VDIRLVANDVHGEQQQSQTRASWAAAESNSSFLTMALSPVGLAAEFFLPHWFRSDQQSRLSLPDWFQILHLN
jgi:hypothetical protein